MPDTEQATTAGQMANWEAQYKELQADYTRKAQALADFERRTQAGELINYADRDQELKRWAQENPDAARAWFGLQEQQSTNGSGGQVGQESSGRWNGYDDSVFDETSDAHRKFKQEFGEAGYRQALFAKMEPELLASTALGRRLTALEERLVAQEEERKVLQERLEHAYNYGIANHHEMLKLKDPRWSEVDEVRKRLSEDPSAWLDVVAWKQKATAEATHAQAQPAAPSAPPPEQLAAAIDQASVVPQGSGGSPIAEPSQSRDVFGTALDTILAKHAGSAA